MRRSIPILAVACVLLGTCKATVYFVSPDGSGDFPTIQAAINAVVSGDMIELGDGVFTGNGNRDLDYLGKAITIRSLRGIAEGCIIDCEGAGGNLHRGFNFHSYEGADAVLEGVTVRNGYLQGSYPQGVGAGAICRNASPTFIGCIFAKCVASGGAGLHCSDLSEPTLIDCLFIDNVTSGAAGGMYCSGGLSPSLTRCTFSGNSAGNFGGGVYFTESTTPTLTDCVFIGNSVENDGGGVRCSYGVVAVLTGCTFWANESGQVAGAVSVYQADCTLRNCTMYGNSALRFGSGISCGFSSSVTMENSIIAFAPIGNAVHCVYSSADLTCCDVYGNVDGDWTDCIADQLGSNGNISADPLFCNPTGGDFQLDCASPCAPFSPQHPECDLVGAWPVGCGASPAIRTTWGGVRTAFTR